MDEKELLHKARNGNKHCLNLLLQNNYKIIYGFLIKLTGDMDLAEDLLQETLLKACMNIEKFRGDSKFSSYLIKISLNIYKNHMRKNNRVIYDSDVIQNISYNGEMEMINALKFKEALEYLQSMSYEKRVSFILKHYYGYSIEEISNIFNVAEGTTKSRLHNTMKKLKKLLG